MFIATNLRNKFEIPLVIKNYLFSSSKAWDIGIDAQIISLDDQSLKAMPPRGTALTTGRDIRRQGRGDGGLCS
jgi:hypothetical protein